MDWEYSAENLNTAGAYSKSTDLITWLLMTSKCAIYISIIYFLVVLLCSILIVLF